VKHKVNQSQGNYQCISYINGNLDSSSPT